MNGWFVYVSASFGPVVGTVVNPPNGGQPGSGYTLNAQLRDLVSGQSKVKLSSQHFIPSFTTTLHVLNIAGTNIENFTPRRILVS